MRVAYHTDQPPGVSTAPETTGNFACFEQFAGLYAQKIYAALSRLSSFEDHLIIERLTITVLTCCWLHRTLMIVTQRPGIFITRVLLACLLEELQRQGQTGKIHRLQKMLFIHPALYTSPLFFHNH